MLADNGIMAREYILSIEESEDNLEKVSEVALLENIFSGENVAKYAERPQLPLSREFEILRYSLDRARHFPGLFKRSAQEGTLEMVLSGTVDDMDTVNEYITKLPVMVEKAKIIDTATLTFSSEWYYTQDIPEKYAQHLRDLIEDTYKEKGVKHTMDVVRAVTHKRYQLSGIIYGPLSPLEKLKDVVVRNNTITLQHASLTY